MVHLTIWLLKFLIKDNLITTLRSKDKTIRVDELLTRTEILALQTDGEAIHNSTYKPDVITSIKTTNQTNTNTLGTTNDFILLLGQTTSTENGLYEQTGAATTTKQTNPTSNTFYIEQTNGIRAIFNTVLDKHMRVYYDKICFNETLTSTSVTTTSIFDIPVIQNKPTIIEVEVLGYLTADFSDSFHGVYKRTIYNNAGNLLNGGTLTSQIKRTSTGFSNLPTITFDTTANPAVLKFSPGTGHTASTKWFIKGYISI